MPLTLDDDEVEAVKAILAWGYGITNGRYTLNHDGIGMRVMAPWQRALRKLADRLNVPVPIWSRTHAGQPEPRPDDGVQDHQGPEGNG